MRSARDMPGHRYSIPAYIGAGGIATASHYVVMMAAVELWRVQPLIATAAGFAVGACVKYALNYFVAFRSSQSHGAAVPRFAVMLATLFVLNTAVFALLHSQLGLHYLVAQVITTCLLIPPGYLMGRLWVFR